MNSFEIAVAALLVLAVMGLVAVAMGWVEASVTVKTPALAKRKAAKAAQGPPQARVQQEAAVTPPAVTPIGRAS